jgi:CheY-like chemotaxis protein
MTITTENVVLDEVYCQAHAEGVPGRYVQLAVSDTGAGMSKAVIARIFEPFFTTKGVGQGTGLGLATVYGIVQQNGGWINVYSEPGQGTTFRIYLPCEQAQSMAEGVLIEEVPAPGSETGLLVEDEPSVLALARTALERAGYTVVAADGPKEALAVLEHYAGPLDLLITDVVMPEMNGRELLRKVEIVRPGIKALFMSGYTADVIAHHGVLEDGVEFLEKPFSRHTLSATVRRVLDKEPGDEVNAPLAEG